METGDLAVIVAGVAARVGVRYYLTGSVASSIWGEPRQTNDVDVVVDLPEDKVDAFCDGFGSDFFVDVESARSAVVRRSMFCVIAPDWGLKVDVIIPSDPNVEPLRLKRAVKTRIADGVEASVSSPEDSILSKMDFFRIGGSQKHIRDIAGILANPAMKLDRLYIEGEASRLGLSGIWDDIKAGRRPKHEADDL